MSRTLTKMSQPWWRDSHISPKNSKWLAENLDEMDHSVQKMLNLVEEDGDSFAKKAEMYYQKRPELIARVEEFYRMYRSLAVRYDHVIGELRKNMPSDLQSQGLGISDVGSVPPLTLSSTDQRLSCCISGSRAAGFEFFLTTGGSSCVCDKGDESSTLDSESESENGSIDIYSGQVTKSNDVGLHRKVIELEAELRDAKEKLRIQHEVHFDCPLRETNTGDSESLVAGNEDELSAAKGKIQLANEEVARLIGNLLGESDRMQRDAKNTGAGIETYNTQGTMLQLVRMEADDSGLDPEHAHVSENEVSFLKHQLEASRSSNEHLQDQLECAKRDTSMWKSELDKEKRETSKLRDRVSRYKANLSERDQEIRELREIISNANTSLSNENLQLRTEMSKLVRKQTFAEDNMKELELRYQSVDEELKRVKAGKAEMETLFRAEVEQVKAGIAERDDHIEQSKQNVGMFTMKYNIAMKESEKQKMVISSLRGELSSKDDRIDELRKHLNGLHIVHTELIAEMERAHKVCEGMRFRVKALEEEVEKQGDVMMEVAEEKREAIRQLCFTLEHYRSGYHLLRQAFSGKRRRLPVVGS